MSGPISELLPYLAALAAALAGSLHCAGMCGPLRLLCTDVKGARWKYQTGRGVAYGSLGALAGGVGFVLPLWALLLLLALGLLGSILNLPTIPAWGRFRRYLLQWGSNSPFLLGMSSGLLPCGLLHGWVAAAAATGHPLQGALLLSMLWAGSIPALELGPALLRSPLEKLRRKFPKSLKAALICIVLLPLAMRLPELMGKPAMLVPLQHCHAPEKTEKSPK